MTNVSPYCSFPVGWTGSAKIMSSQPLVGIVNEVLQDTYLSGSYNHIAGGSTKVVLHYMPRNSGGWSASFTVQNLGTATTQITARYCGSDGTQASTTTVDSIGVGASKAWYLPSVNGLADGLYSVVVTSDRQPIGAMANALNTGIAGDGFTTYNGHNR